MARSTLGSFCFAKLHRYKSHAISFSSSGASAGVAPADFSRRSANSSSVSLRREPSRVLDDGPRDPGGARAPLQRRGRLEPARCPPHRLLGPVEHRQQVGREVPELERRALVLVVLDPRPHPRGRLPEVEVDRRELRRLPPREPRRHPELPVLRDSRRSGRTGTGGATRTGPPPGAASRPCRAWRSERSGSESPDSGLSMTTRLVLMRERDAAGQPDALEALPPDIVPFAIPACCSACALWYLAAVGHPARSCATAALACAWAAS